VSWVDVANLEWLPDGSRQVVTLEAGEVLLVHHRGNVYAVEARCPHMGGDLSRGKVTDDSAIVCPRHHTVFSLATGEVRDWAPWPPVVGRVLGAVKQEQPLRVFETRVEDGRVLIRAGD
jgi:nitrite reductase/ring-hydroxylating ferredoxin subunit